MALLFGIHENIDPATTIARLGGNATRVFTGGVLAPRDLVPAARYACSPSWAAGATAVWSFKPDPAAVASGAWRAQITALGEFLAANPDKKTVVVPWHEPENDVGPGKAFASPQGFVQMFDTVAGWLRAAHPGVTVCHAALGYRYGDIRGGITDAVAPQWRTSADVHAIDIYSGRSNALDTILPELPGFQRWKTLVARGDRWGVTERGWTITPGPRGAGPGGDTRALTIAREAQWLAGLPAERQPEMYLLWSTEGTENDPGLIFDAGAERAARQITGHFAGRAGTAGTPTAPPAPAAAPAPAPAAAPAPAGAQVHEVTCPLCSGSGKYRFTL